MPTTQAEAEVFFLKNNVQLHVTGSKRNLDLSLNWKMTKPDWNLGTPENGKLSLNAKGHNPRWGDYSLSRDLNWSIANKVIEVNWVGSAAFATGLLAPASPIETEVKFKVLLDERDLIGKFMKKFNGKEYSIDFPQGSGALPKIQKRYTREMNQQIGDNFANFWTQEINDKSQRTTDTEAIDDGEELEFINIAFDTLGFTPEEKANAFKLTATVMHLDEMTFKQKSREVIIDDLTLFSPDGGLVSNSPYINVHLGAMQDNVCHQFDRVLSLYGHLNTHRSEQFHCTVESCQQTVNSLKHFRKHMANHNGTSHPF